MELTPRTLDEPDDLDDDPGPPRSRGPHGWRRRLSLIVVGVVVLALGFVVFKGLNEATLYFRNADEAVAEREELGDRRFRLQGTVDGEPVETADGVNFDVTYNGVSVPVRHQGAPAELFEPGVPVVLEGRWDLSGEFFASDDMMVKHDEKYESREDYEERVGEAESDRDADGEATER